MSNNNPFITASDFITDVEARLSTPNISTSVYLPWISYAYQKTYAALANASQAVRETLFGNYIAVTLANGTAEYALSTIIPRFASFIKLEILYGATGDQRVRLRPLRSVANWRIQGNVSTTYQSKSVPYYYLLEDILGIIPTPPASDTTNAILYAWYVRRPYQITMGADIIDIDYRFIYPIVNYVQAKAIERENEDYQQSAIVENNFMRELEMVAQSAASEFNENEGDGVQVDASSALFDDPMQY